MQESSFFFLAVSSVFGFYLLVTMVKSCRGACGDHSVGVGKVDITSMAVRESEVGSDWRL